jgi:hypothetical protein
MQQSIVKFYCFVAQTLLKMFRPLQCPSSGARQTAVAASAFGMNVEVEVFLAVVGMNAYYTYTNVCQHFVHSHEDTLNYFVQPIQTKLLLRSIKLDTFHEVGAWGGVVAKALRY